ncbi:MAG: redoxin domain-containing protein [candidate division WOR-3 bacterium]
MSEGAHSRRVSDRLFLLMLLVGSLSFNVFQGWEVRRLKTTLGSQPNSVNLSIGASVPPIAVSRLNDVQETITYSGISSPTVLYVFTPTCKWCDRNMGNIRTLASLRGNSYRFVGLSLSKEGLKEYLDAHKLNFPIYKNPSPESIRLLGLGTTPHTIIVSPEGKVLKNWLGAYSGSLQSEVEVYFGLRLPGLVLTEGSKLGRELPEKCVQCVWEGLLYSVGASINVGSRRMRCQEDGQWAEFLGTVVPLQR